LAVLFLGGACVLASFWASLVSLLALFFRRDFFAKLLEAQRMLLSTSPHSEKPLKTTKHRIVLRDGRELQYHPPFSKVDPTNLSEYIPENFKNSLPAIIEVEIGPGKGEFLARRAAEYPDRFFIGIDRRLDRTQLTEKKLNRITNPDESDSNLNQNWRILRQDARGFLKAGLPKIQVLHVYHPDPWPKARHHKHRFFRSPDAKTWAEALVMGGELRLSTDHREYFEEIIDIVSSWDFLKSKIIFQKNLYNSAPRSHFEGIFLKKREPVFKAVFERI